MQADSLLLSEILLLYFQLRRQVKQAQLLLLLGNHLIKKRQVIAEKQNARRIIYLRILADVALKENRCHRSNVLVAEAQIGARESRIARLDRLHANFALLIEHVAGKDLFRQRHGAKAVASSLAHHFEAYF